MDSSPCLSYTSRLGVGGGEWPRRMPAATGRPSPSSTSACGGGGDGSCLVPFRRRSGLVYGPFAGLMLFSKRPTLRESRRISTAGLDGGLGSDLLGDTPTIKARQGQATWTDRRFLCSANPQCCFACASASPRWTTRRASPAPARRRGGRSAVLSPAPARRRGGQPNRPAVLHLHLPIYLRCGGRERR